MGCGRVGSSLAIELEAAGHTVSVIDQAREAFRRLGPNFKGRTVTGVGFDRDTLLEAGIQEADAFAAVSNGDNSNILAARVARETYGVNMLSRESTIQVEQKFINVWAFQRLQRSCGQLIRFCVD